MQSTHSDTEKEASVMHETGQFTANELESASSYVTVQRQNFWAPL